MSTSSDGIAPASLAELQAAISQWHEARKKMASEGEDRLWEKLRLEWNYNSNHIEGTRSPTTRRNFSCFTTRPSVRIHCVTTRR